jgi:hypothetical protein
LRHKLADFTVTVTVPPDATGAFIAVVTVVIKVNLASLSHDGNVRATIATTTAKTTAVGRKLKQLRSP